MGLGSVRFRVNLNLMLLDQIGPVEERISEATEQSDFAAGERTVSLAVGRQQDPGLTYPLGTVPRDPQK